METVLKQDDAGSTIDSMVRLTRLRYPFSLALTPFSACIQCEQTMQSLRTMIICTLRYL